MSKANKSAIYDRRWQQLAIECRYNWERASQRLFGRTLTHQQRQVIREVKQTGSMTSVASGHGTGKSDLLAQIALLYLVCYPESRVMILANKVDQVLAGLLKYARIHWQKAVRRNPWLAQYFRIGHKSIYAVCSPNVWCLQTKSYKPGTEESLAGEHAEHLMWIVDEASSIGERAFQVITGSLTQDDNRMVLLSQPTRQSGYFYDTHHRLRKIPGNPDGIYTAITLSSEDSPLVTEKWLKMKARELGGRHTDAYRTKVLGQFAAGGDGGMLLTRDEALQGQLNRPLLTKDWGWLALADVGNGGDRSVLMIGRVSGFDHERVFIPKRVWITKIRAHHFARFIHRQADPESYPGIVIALDGGGIGAATADHLEELGRQVERIHWGLPCFSDDDKKRFINLRAAANIWARDAVLQGRMKLPPGVTVIDQASRVPIEINEKSQYCVMSKKLMKKEGIPSPDVWDCCCFVTIVTSYHPATRLRREDEKQQREEADRIYAELMAEEED